MKTHVTILGWLQILLGVLDLLLALAIFGMFAGIGVLVGIGGEPAAFLASGIVGTVVGSVIVLTGIPNLVAGLGLLAHRNWARILTLVLATLNGLKFPWGTAAAVYTFWVLLDDRTRRLFERS